MKPLPTLFKMRYACSKAGRDATPRAIQSWRQGARRAPLWFPIALADELDLDLATIVRELSARRERWLAHKDWLSRGAAS